ncbi:N-acetylmuramic acid 6-phosphate etherase [Synechococcus elongatus]|uniref:N-acetylmuramic acid 6-phosphate etherase n=2 Tax=Synechococcus elongatus TaxID=32046 RepID=MURQ_SYNE7|nr:N-acetylmuramic acid 6-phosphate etherase [Synechococcus elongatus]O33701.3 RecName: Full=N-acetylmuramic acid 6-phosphate etherase; Short=MurNAc-6-P etherase; AltName: Full=N-acetylmuramic acid 6-phosphate hydrolase; AltName: Full=N-acetylmuramic acid 6-phosphate lyase [Synechococcus elongatus PCC 7942 = FACHB-805]Q5N1U7.1 RecName: Full=N-acetylmuramic acid 6-phosphate etherase; Short=MurNAc-6-P etherase; AltName: Full=N-acetylmuramic acid 6-phosphate hydrolase; AltName: Full=N-acetylmuramic 
MDPSLSDRGHLLTEQANPASQALDQLSPLELVDLFNQEDQHCLAAVAQAREAIAQAIEYAAQAIARGGRLFYIGAGTSGRLGVLDAAECPPTFCSDPEQVQGILAGGSAAMFRSSEGLEDRAEDGAVAIAEYQIGPRDFILGITAGGTTPYVHGALEAARSAGAKTGFLACVPADQVAIAVDVDIRVPVGPEILAGSTRLKAGTVTKMVLNQISTGAMVRIGKVYGNRMVDVAVTNRKLEDRALRILSDLLSIDRQQAAALLGANERSVKQALLQHWTGLEPAEAAALLTEHQGHLRAAVTAFSSLR